MPFPVGWPPRPASGRRSLRFYATGTATANFRDNAYLFRDANNALTVLGLGLNGRVLVSRTTAGLSGNTFMVQVTVPTTGGPLALSATLSGSLLTVRLATDASNFLVPASNTATLVAAAIGGVGGFAAEATGTGADSLGLAEGPHFLFFGGGMPIIPTPFVLAESAARTRTVAGNTVMSGSPAGGGTLDPVSAEVMHWSHSIKIVNTGAALLTYSFDGVNIHGIVPATTPAVIMDYRYEAGICLRGTGTFSVEAW